VRRERKERMEGGGKDGVGGRAHDMELEGESHGWK